LKQLPGRLLQKPIVGGQQNVRASRLGRHKVERIEGTIAEPDQPLCAKGNCLINLDVRHGQRKRCLCLHPPLYGRVAPHFIV